MENTNNISEELLALDWIDFSQYPKKGENMMVHAEGYDTLDRSRKHFFFEIEEFDPMNFPTKEMSDKLNEHHCKWVYTWLPPKNQMPE